MFKDDLPLESLRTWELRLILIQMSRDEHFSKHILKRSRHPLLLRDAAMILDAQDDRVLACHEGVVLDRLDDVQELDLAGHRVSVKDEGHPVGSVPAVELNAPAAHPEAAGVRLDRAGGLDLVPGEVAVVGRGDVVVGQRPRHVVIHGPADNQTFYYFYLCTLVSL